MNDPRPRPVKADGYFVQGRIEKASWRLGYAIDRLDKIKPWLLEFCKKSEINVNFLDALTEARAARELLLEAQNRIGDVRRGDSDKLEQDDA